MKNMKVFLLAMIVALFCNSFSSSAQIVVSIHPPRPHYVRVVAPSPRHVWIDEEWTPHGDHYEFSGGHWALPPRPGLVWVSGHWSHRGRGDFWVPGHWR
jgi:hypothetical protein